MAVRVEPAWRRDFPDNRLKSRATMASSAGPTLLPPGDFLLLVRRGLVQFQKCCFISSFHLFGGSYFEMSFIFPFCFPFVVVDLLFKLAESPHPLPHRGEGTNRGGTDLPATVLSGEGGFTVT